jgi:hypothetical protein
MHELGERHTCRPRRAEPDGSDPRRSSGHATRLRSALTKRSPRRRAPRRVIHTGDFERSRRRLERRYRATGRELVATVNPIEPRQDARRIEHEKIGQVGLRPARTHRTGPNPGAMSGVGSGIIGRQSADPLQERGKSRTGKSPNTQRDFSIGPRTVNRATPRTLDGRRPRGRNWVSPTGTSVARIPERTAGYWDGMRSEHKPPARRRSERGGSGPRFERRRSG